jgi:hypothetical protein
MFRSDLLEVCGWVALAFIAIWVRHTERRCLWCGHDCKKERAA